MKTEIQSVVSPFPLETKLDYIKRVTSDRDVRMLYKQPKYRLSFALRHWDEFKSKALVVINTSMDSEYFIREHDPLHRVPIDHVPRSANLEKFYSYAPLSV